MAGNVYSFGVILLELLVGKAVVSEGYELAKLVSSKSKQNDNLDQILESDVSRALPANGDQMLAVLKVALACVSESPEASPKARSVRFRSLFKGALKFFSYIPYCVLFCFVQESVIIISVSQQHHRGTTHKPNGEEKYNNQNM